MNKILNDIKQRITFKSPQPHNAIMAIKNILNDYRTTKDNDVLYITSRLSTLIDYPTHNLIQGIDSVKSDIDFFQARVKNDSK